jgi:flagellar biosynthesis regulator FlbT
MSGILDEQRASRCGAEFARLKMELDNRRQLYVALKVKKSQLEYELGVLDGEVRIAGDAIKELEGRLGKAGRVARLAERPLPYFVMDALDRIAEEDGTTEFRDLVKRLASQMKDEAILQASGMKRGGRGGCLSVVD